MVQPVTVSMPALTAVEPILQAQAKPEAELRPAAQAQLKPEPQVHAHYGMAGGQQMAEDSPPSREEISRPDEPAPAPPAPLFSFLGIPHQEKDWFTIREVADILRVTHRTVRAMIREGRLLAYRVGGRRILVKRENVFDLFELIDPAHYNAGEEKPEPESGSP